MSIHATTEQQAGIDLTLSLSAGKIACGNAYAGTGKTTTAGLIAAAARVKHNWSTLYICFNAAMAAEARARFPNVKCVTGHALAHAVFGRRYAAIKLPNGKPKLITRNLFAGDVTAHTGCNNTDASLILDGLNHFLTSSDFAPATKHFGDIPGGASHLVSLLTRLWLKMADEQGPCPITHDGYLKLWVNSLPQIAEDLIIMDEAQDLNPVMLSWIIQQTKAGKRVLLIGDTHQAIYSFRNATNAMDWASQRAAQTFPLTESWRFGEAVANAASRLLSDYKGDRVLLKGRGPKKESSDKTTCILARTNGTLLHQAIRIGRRQKIHFAATNEKTGWTPRHAYRFQEMEDAASLMCGRQLIKGRSSALIGQYANWDELHAAAMPEDGNGDPALASIVKFVLDAGATEIPYLLREIEQSSVGPDEAEIHFSSAHRSKGKEWHRVHLQDDFPPLDNEDRMKKFVAKKGASGFAEEINLLYVAVTRGCHGLTPYESASNYFASVGITAPPPSKPLTAIAAFAARRASQKRTRLF